MEETPSTFDVKIKDSMITISFSYEEKDVIVTLTLSKAVKLFRLMDKNIKQLMEEY